MTGPEFYVVIYACIPGEKLRIDMEVILSNPEKCLSKEEKDRKTFRQRAADPLKLYTISPE